MDDDTALANNARFVTAVVPELSRSLQVQKGNLNINVHVVGTTPAYVPQRSYRLTAGRTFTPGDDAARRRPAVIASARPHTLPANRDAVIGPALMTRGPSLEV